MKSKIVSLIVLCCMMGILQAFEARVLHRIDRDHIELSKQSVKSTLRKSKLRQIVTVSGIGALIGFSAYKFLYGGNVLEGKIVNDVGTLSSSDVHNIRVVLKAAIDKLDVSKPTLTWPFTWAAWLGQQAYSNAQLILIGVASTVVFNGMNNFLGPISKYITRLDGFLDRTVANIFHKENLEWYIANHVDLVQVFNMLEYYAAIIEGRSIQIPANSLTDVATTVSGVLEGSQNQKDALKDLVGYWNMYVQQLELVLGFIEFKRASHHNPLEGERMKDIGNKIITLTNSFAECIEQKIADLGNNKKPLIVYEDLRILRAQIGQELSNFSVLESFKRVDFTAEIIQKS